MLSTTLVPSPLVTNLVACLLACLLCTQATGEAPYKIGFFIREVESQSESMEFIQEAEDTITNSCPLTDDNTLIDLSDKGSWYATGTVHQRCEQHD